MLETCSLTKIDEKKVKKIKEKFPKEETLEKTSEIFKILGDQTRIKILIALSFSELCVCDLSYLLKMSQSSISHQLQKLRAMGIVKYRREGKMVFYSIKDKHISSILKEGLKHARE